METSVKDTEQVSSTESTEKVNGTQIIGINDKVYDVATLPAQVKLLIQHIKDLDEDINSRMYALDTLKAARYGFMVSLESELVNVTPLPDLPESQEKADTE